MSNILLVALGRSVEKQYNFFSEKFVTALLVDIFNFILDMQITQPPTSYYIMSVYEIGYFVAYNEKNLKLHLHVCRLCLTSRLGHLGVIF